MRTKSTIRLMAKSGVTHAPEGGMRATSTGVTIAVKSNASITMTSQYVIHFVRRGSISQRSENLSTCSTVSAEPGYAGRLRLDSVRLLYEPANAAESSTGCNEEEAALVCRFLEPHIMLFPPEGVSGFTAFHANSLSSDAMMSVGLMAGVEDVPTMVTLKARRSLYLA